MTPLVILKNGRNHPIQQIKETLQNVGLRVIISFDSRHTRVAEITILCPNHGKASCDCHIVIMLVYGIDGTPATLIAYGQDSEIWVSLTYPPGLRPSLTLQNQISDALRCTTLQT